jgi:predicted secreted protein
MEKIKNAILEIRTEANGLGQRLGGTKSANISWTNGLVDVTSSDSDGWKEQVSGLMEFTVDVEGIVAKGAEGFATLKQCSLNGLPVYVTLIDQEEGFSYEGKTFISDFAKDKSYEEAGTYSATLSGTGKLESEAYVGSVTP